MPVAQGQRGSDPFPHPIPLSTASSSLGACRSRGCRKIREFCSELCPEFCPSGRKPLLWLCPLFPHPAPAPGHKTFIIHTWKARKTEQALPGQSSDSAFLLLLLLLSDSPCQLPEGQGSHSRGVKPQMPKSCTELPVAQRGDSGSRRGSARGGPSSPAAPWAWVERGDTRDSLQAPWDAGDLRSLSFLIVLTRSFVGPALVMSLSPFLQDPCLPRPPGPRLSLLPGDRHCREGGGGGGSCRGGCPASLAPLSSAGAGPSHAQGVLSCPRTGFGTGLAAAGGSRGAVGES